MKHQDRLFFLSQASVNNMHKGEEMHFLNILPYHYGVIRRHCIDIDMVLNKPARVVSLHLHDIKASC